MPPAFSQVMAVKVAIPEAIVLLPLPGVTYIFAMHCWTTYERCVLHAPWADVAALSDAPLSPTPGAVSIT